MNVSSNSNWSGVLFDAQWTDTNSFGLPKSHNRSIVTKYAGNPQYLIEPLNDARVVVSLSQRTSRERHYANFCVFQLDKYEERLNEFDEDSMVVTSPVTPNRQSDCFILKGGCRYALIVATDLPGKIGSYTLKILIDLPLTDVQIVSNDRLQARVIPEVMSKYTDQVKRQSVLKQMVLHKKLSSVIQNPSKRVVKAAQDKDSDIDSIDLPQQIIYNGKGEPEKIQENTWIDKSQGPDQNCNGIWGDIFEY
jgi:hypothetical protein